MEPKKYAAAIELFGKEYVDEQLKATAKADKAAQDRGVAYKGDDAPPAWAQRLAERLDALESTLKAAPVPPDEEAEAPVAVEEMAESIIPDEEMIAEEAPADDDDVVDLSVGQFRQILDSCVEAAIARQMGTMTGALAEFENNMSKMGYARAKEDAAPAASQPVPPTEDQAIAAIEALRGRVNALEGLQPRSAQLGIPISPQEAQVIKEQAGASSGNPISNWIAEFIPGTNGNAPR